MPQKSILSKATTLSTINSFLTRHKVSKVEVNQLAFIKSPIIIKALDDTLSQFLEYQTSTKSKISSINSEKKKIGEIRNNLKEFFRTEETYCRKLDTLASTIKKCIEPYYTDISSTLEPDRVQKCHFVDDIDSNIKIHLNSWHSILKSITYIRDSHLDQLSKHEINVYSLEDVASNFMSRELTEAYKKFFNLSLGKRDMFLPQLLKTLENSNVNSMVFDELMSEPQQRIMRYPLMIKTMLSVASEEESFVLENLLEKIKIHVLAIESYFSRTNEIAEYLSLMKIIEGIPVSAQNAGDEVLGIFPVFKVPFENGKLGVALDDYKTTHTILILKSGLILLDYRIKTTYIENVQDGVAILKKKRKIKAVGYVKFNQADAKFNAEYRLLCLSAYGEPIEEYFQFQPNYTSEFMELQKGFFNEVRHKHSAHGIDYLENIYTCYTSDPTALSDIRFLRENEEPNVNDVIIIKRNGGNFDIFKKDNYAGCKTGNLSRRNFISYSSRSSKGKQENSEFECR
eukprot:NODE_142_length_15935_cov_1.439126.p3 type:complete len:513 gc:universal NODE_142_length_15935_cov_1.439126:7642-9180(+)